MHVAWASSQVMHRNIYGGMEVPKPNPESMDASDYF